MMTPKPRRRSPQFRPAPEHLEERKLLTKVIRGTDIDGDTWTLRLIGPGDFRVTTQNNVPLDQPSLIQDITIAGGETDRTRLEGFVRQGPNGDGRVFFQNLNTLNNPPVADVNFDIVTDLGGRGLLAIDIPHFWLGDTSGGSFVPPTGEPVGSIRVPDGVTSLRFGGIDTTAFFGSNPSQRLDQNNRNDAFNVELGLPQFLGTSVIVDRVITANQTGPMGQTFTDTATFTVNGRLNLFQANEIVGDPSRPTVPYEGPNQGGTTVVSAPDRAGTTGAIGFIQVRGDATNFSVSVSSGFADQSNARIQEFYIAGETNKVVVNAPGGIKNVLFGKGMDAVNLNTRGVLHLVANRGAVGSTLVSNGPIVLANFGGDVIDSRILSGYFVNPEDPTGPLNVGAGGRMTVLVGGDILNSLFASSVVPDPDGVFDDPDNFLFERGTILAKYEGKIDNSELIPFAPEEAFFATRREIARGPIVPPNVPEPPFPAPPRIHRGQVGLSFRRGPLGRFRTTNVNPDEPRTPPQRIDHPVRRAQAQRIAAGQTPAAPRRRR